MNIYSIFLLWTYTPSSYYEHILHLPIMNIYSIFLFWTYTPSSYSEHILHLPIMKIYSIFLFWTYTPSFLHLSILNIYLIFCWSILCWARKQTLNGCWQLTRTFENKFGIIYLSIYIFHWFYSDKITDKLVEYSYVVNKSVISHFCLYSSFINFVY